MKQKIVPVVQVSVTTHQFSTEDFLYCISTSEKAPKKSIKTFKKQKLNKKNAKAEIVFCISN